MYPSTVVLTVIQGNPVGETYVFETPAWCMIGRAQDCDLRLPHDDDHADVSRHHCLLEIDLPAIRVRDLASSNGTFVNGLRIGLSPDCKPVGPMDLRGFAAQELRVGDVIRVGQTVFRVDTVEAGYTDLVQSGRLVGV